MTIGAREMSAPPIQQALEQKDFAEQTASGLDRPLIVHSQELLQGRRELWIEHGEDMYRLRLTASGKLYLTK